MVDSSANIDIDQLKTEYLKKIANVQTPGDLEQLRIQALGKKGNVTALLKTLSQLPIEKRKDFGQKVNLVKDDISNAIDHRKNILDDAILNEKLHHDILDLSLPIPAQTIGKIHPISQVIDEVIEIFGNMGFSVMEGPDIEDDFHNFTALNIPPEHPARQMHDTFYLHNDDKHNNSYVLRTHTSPVQIRTMENTQPPIRIIAPGRTYRSDSDMTHTPMFHQVEGLVIDKTTNFSHLKGCLRDFCQAFFGVDDVVMRFRPSYFPFTEPSAEVDIGCTRRDDTLHIGAGDDWLEILGSGMVNPKVLRACNINPDEYQGFAFGIGIERLAMLKYGIPDLRQFFDSDLRWCDHYGFSPLEIASLVRGLTV